MDIRVKFAELIWDEKYDYGKKRVIKRIKDECRKNRLLRVRVKGLDMLSSKNIVNEIRQSLYRASGYIGLLCLSECDWGKPAVYNKEEGYYDDYICIPKDFDNMDAQELAVIEKANEMADEIKRQRNPIKRNDVEGNYSIFDEGFMDFL